MPGSASSLLITMPSFLVMPSAVTMPFAYTGAALSDAPTDVPLSGAPTDVPLLGTPPSDDDFDGDGSAAEMFGVWSRVTSPVVPPGAYGSLHLASPPPLCEHTATVVGDQVREGKMICR